MHINQIEIQNFRNLKPQRISFSSTVSVVVGDNAQGKTNLLESVFILSHGKSFRSSKLSDLISWGKESSIINGLFLTSGGEKNLKCEIKDGRKSVHLNGRQVEKASYFYGQTTSVIFTPSEIQLVYGAPAYRRQYLDRLISMTDSSYVDTLVQYQRTVKSRNIELANNCSGINQRLEPWEIMLSKLSIEITKKRHEAINILRYLLEKHYSSLSFYDSKSTKETSICELKTQLPKTEDCSENVMLEYYKKSRERDLRIQSTSFGIHHDDVSLFISNQDKLYPAKLASQGQSRCIAIALKISALDYIKQKNNESPILLLDDVHSEIDKHRKKALFRTIKELNSQVIVTATEINDELCSLLGDFDVLEMSDGEVMKV